MTPINVMVNGLPGNVARMVADFILKDDRFELIPYSLTGPEIEAAEDRINGTAVKLIRPEQRDSDIEQIKQS